MKKKILVFGASNSNSSINQKFAKYAASQFIDAEINLIDLNDYEMPIFSIDREKQDGIPRSAHDFLKKVKESDLVLISFAEHNGNYTVAYKNISDWVSRIGIKVWENKQTLLLSTSPGSRGGKSVMEIALKEFQIRGAKIIGGFSLPNYYSVFSEDEGILDENLKIEFQNIIMNVNLPGVELNEIN